MSIDKFTAKIELANYILNTKESIQHLGSVVAFHEFCAEKCQNLDPEHYQNWLELSREIIQEFTIELLVMNKSVYDTLKKANALDMETQTYHQLLMTQANNSGLSNENVLLPIFIRNADKLNDWFTLQQKFANWIITKRLRSGEQIILSKFYTESLNELEEEHFKQSVLPELLDGQLVAEHTEAMIGVYTPSVAKKHPPTLLDEIMTKSEQVVTARNALNLEPATILTIKLTKCGIEFYYKDYNKFGITAINNNVSSTNISISDSQIIASAIELPFDKIVV